jgi:outer membrane biosynthesis protein TonB
MLLQIVQHPLKEEICMSGSNFDLLVQEVLKQQRVMEELEKENRELRHQLAELHAGRGIIIEICGKSFTLGDKVTESVPRVDAQPAEPPAQEVEQEEVEAPQPPVEVPVAELATAVEAGEWSEAAAHEPVEQPAEVVAAAPAQPVRQEAEAIAAAPVAQVAEQEPEAVAAAPAAQAASEQTASSATFLEEIMLDEFATASTKPMAVWNGPVEATRKLQDIDEEQKARLRRELTGSFLLE